MPFQGPRDRRDFLRDSVGHWVEQLVERAEERVIQQRYFRPPGAIPEVGFLAACTRCGLCTEACPPDAIIKVPPSGGLAAGTPHIEPRTQPCVVCVDMPCVAVCPTGALLPPTGGWRGYRLAEVEFVPERCITFRGTICRVCASVCPVGEAALTFDEQDHPVLKREGCVGCGVCVRACVTAPSSFELRIAEN